MDGHLIGVDPHKATNVVAVLDERGELIEHETFATSASGVKALERWSRRFPDRRWAVESASGLGRPIAQRLAAAGEQVTDVPAKLSARMRVLSTGGGRKNDVADAAHTAFAAWHSQRLTEVGEEDHVSVIRMLSDRRDDLVKERTRRSTACTSCCADLIPGGAPKHLSAHTAAGLLRRVRATSAPSRARASSHRI